MSPKASGSPSERPITSASERELIVFSFPIGDLGSRGSETISAAAASCGRTIHYIPHFTTLTRYGLTICSQDYPCSRVLAPVGALPRGDRKNFVKSRVAGL